MTLKILFSIIVMLLLIPSVVFAETVVYPQVTSVAPATVKPGETITLSGKNFARVGQTYCWRPEKKLMTYQTVIGAYRQGVSPTSGMPNYRLPIISVTDSTLVAQIPATMTNGEYLIGYNAEYPKGICQGYGDILVGFARYDPITVVGGSSAVVTRPTTVITPIAASTVTAIPTPQVIGIPVSPEPTRGMESDVAEQLFVGKIFYSILEEIKDFFLTIGLFK